MERAEEVHQPSEGGFEPGHEGENGWHVDGSARAPEHIPDGICHAFGTDRESL